MLCGQMNEYAGYQGKSTSLQDPSPVVEVQVQGEGESEVGSYPPKKFSCQKFLGLKNLYII